MIVKLLNEHHLEFLSLKGGCRCSSESTLVKMPHCWKSHVTAQLQKIKSSSKTEPGTSRLQKASTINPDYFQFVTN